MYIEAPNAKQRAAISEAALLFSKARTPRSEKVPLNFIQKLVQLLLGART